MIEAPRLGRLTQGTIFTGAFSEDYADAPVWGVIITARCDTTHEKVPVVNYLPVVRIEDWICGRGGLLILDRAYTSIKNRFISLLKKAGLSESLLEVHSPKVVADENFPMPTDPSESKKSEKQAKDSLYAAELAERMSAIERILNQEEPTASEVKALVQSDRQVVVEVLMALCTHKLAGYYFLPTIGNDTELSSPLGYVVLLREIHHLPRKVVSVLVQGATAEDIEKAASLSKLCFEKFDFAWPVAEIKSPWIEHLMQSFCGLFGRIGISDFEKSKVEAIVDAIAVKAAGGK
jgi:hypothetical protein